MDWQTRFASDKIQHMAASQFLAHPSNPRRHPADQRAAVKGSLDTLGWVAPVIINARTGYVVDGHERIMQALGKGDNTPVPYLEIDLSEAEEAQFLATFDWTTQMAYYDADTMRQLTALIETDNPDMLTMLGAQADKLQLSIPEFGAIDEAEQTRLDQLAPKMVTCPHCGREFDANEQT